MCWPQLNPRRDCLRSYTIETVRAGLNRTKMENGMKTVAALIASLALLGGISMSAQAGGCSDALHNGGSQAYYACLNSNPQ